MLSLVVFFVFILIFLEVRGFFLQNRGVAVRIFTPTLWEYVFILFLFVVVVQGPQGYLFLIPAFGSLFYALKREEFVRLVGDRSRLQIIRYEGYGVVLHWVVIMTVLWSYYQLVEGGSSSRMSLFEEMVLTSAYSSLALLGLIYFSCRRLTKGSFFSAIGAEMPRGVFSKEVWMPVLLGLFFAGISSWIILCRGIQPETPMSAIIETADSALMIGFFIILAIIVAPFVEEVSFRGYFYHILKETRGKIFAFILVSLTFGALHIQQYWGDWMAILMVGILGFALTGVRVFCRNTFASILMHYVYNAGVIIIPVVFLSVTNPIFVEYQAFQDQLTFHQKEDLLQRSLESNPDFSMASYELARTYLNEGKNLDQALMLIEELIEREGERGDFVELKDKIRQKMN